MANNDKTIILDFMAKVIPISGQILGSKIMILKQKLPQDNIHHLAREIADKMQSA